MQISLFSLFCSMTTIIQAAAASASIPTTQRDFIRVDLSDFDNQQQEITKTLMKAATSQGFFYGNI